MTYNSLNREALLIVWMQIPWVPAVGVSRISPAWAGPAPAVHCEDSLQTLLPCSLWEPSLAVHLLHWALPGPVHTEGHSSLALLAIRQEWQGALNEETFGRSPDMVGPKLT